MKASGDGAKKEVSMSGDVIEKEKKCEGGTASAAVEDTTAKPNVTNGLKTKVGDGEKKNTPSNYNYLLQIENLPGDAGELLGSVTFSPSGNPEGGPAVRTSARVIQKLRMDTARPPTPPLSEKKTAQSEKPEKPEEDTPKTKKTTHPARIHKVMWSNTERNIFFEALNEYGRDFEAIAHFMNHKFKRKQPMEQPMYKSFHVRQMYYQTFHKISKYLRFSDDVRKCAQELYALINYGEMRRKLIFVNEKACMKLKQLVYRGYVTIREKGKNIKIKTPSCRALRKLNQLEEWQEEIKLPQRVEVSFVPANMESWGRVQTIAQNPRIRASIPLQKRVVSVLKLLQNKWRSQDLRLCTRTTPMTCHISGMKSKTCKQMQQLQQNELRDELVNSEKLLCFAPPAKTVIHRPMVNLTEFSSSYNICLNSYEERIGATVRGESLFPEQWKTHREFIRAQKRQRNDSGSDNKSPDTKKNRVNSGQASECTSDTSISIQTIDFSVITNQDSNIQPLIFDPPPPPESSAPEENKASPEMKIDAEMCKEAKESKTKKTKITKKDTPPSNHRNITKSFKPLISEEVVRKIREGWTTHTVMDLTFGDLYVMFGSDFKLTLDYRWVDPPPKIESSDSAEEASISPVEQNPVVVKLEPPSEVEEFPPKLPEDLNKMMTEKPCLPGDRESENVLGRKLSQLLLISNMMEKSGRRRTTCSCGHICDKGFKVRDAESKLYSNDGVFKHPVTPQRNFSEPYRYVNVMRNNRNFRLKPRAHRGVFPSRQVVVQRILPLQPGVQPSYVTATVDYDEPSSTSPAIPSARSKYDSIVAKNHSVTSTITSKNHKAEVQKHRQERSENWSSRREEQNEINSETDKEVKEDFSDEDNSAIKSIMELSLPSLKFGDNEDSRLLGDGFIPSATPPMSPLRIIRDGGGDTKWLEENIHDYSFSSLLGHLDSHLDERPASPGSSGVNQQEDHVDSSIDLMYKFSSND